MSTTITEYHAVRPLGIGFATIRVTVTSDGNKDRIISSHDTFEQATDEMNARNEILFGGKYEDSDHGPVFVRTR